MPDPLVDEFRAHLAELAELEPTRQIEALLLLGVEREAIVTVAYRADTVEGRLARMPVDDDVRRAVARAIRWVWRDEEGHTLWVRGALLRAGLGARAMLAQVEGEVAGYAASRQNHLTWRQAPVQRAVAELLESAAAATGRIPPEVRAHLHWNTFRDACAFHRAAETTAAMGWARLAELAAAPGSGVAEVDARGFATLAADEDRHARLFDILARAFDPDDRCTLPADELRARLARVGQRFLAVPEPGSPAWVNPLGKGAPVLVREGRDAAALVERLVDELGIDELLATHGRRVAVKASFMAVTRREDPSPGVSPGILRALRDALTRRGAAVDVLEAPNLYERFHDGRAVEAVARYLGVGPAHDTQQDQVPHAYLRGIGEDTVSARWRDADVRLLLGKLRTHPTARVVAALDAAEGLGVRQDDLVFVDRRAEQHTAALMVLDAFPAHAALLDAHTAVPDGLMGFFGADHPLQPLRIYASRDVVALDVVAARHAGLDPGEDGLLVRHAMDWFGDPRPVRVDGPDLPIAGLRLPDHARRTALLAQLAWPVWATAGLRGALFLPRFDEAAFPPRDPSPVVRALRDAVARVVHDDPHPLGVEVPGLLPTRFVPVGGGSVRVADVGEGPVTVFLHGYPDTLQIWSALIGRLPGRRVAFDWPGLGYSDRIGEAADPDALGDVVCGLLDAWGIDRATVVAHDMGGQAAIAFAARHPDRCARLVVMNSLLFGDGATSWEIALMRRAGLADLAFRFAPGLVYERCIRGFLPPGTALPDALDADFRGGFGRARGRLAAMCRAYDAALPELPHRMFAVRCPVSLLWAERDGHFPVEHAERLGRMIGAAVEVVPDGRHWMAWSRAGEVAARIVGAQP